MSPFRAPLFMPLLTDTTKAYILLIITTSCWAMNVILGKLAVGEITPMQLVSARWLGVTLLLLVFARQHIVKDWPLIRRHLWFVVLMGSSGFTAFNALYYVAAHSTSAINIGILQGSIPVFVLLGGMLIFGTRASLLQFIGVAFTLLGVIIVASGGSLDQLRAFNFNIGDVFMLLACLLYAAYSLGLSRRPKASALGLFTAMAFVAFIVSLPLLAVDTWQQGFIMPSPKGWFIVALVTLLPSFLAQVLFIRSVELIGPARAGVFINLIPVFASVMAVYYLQEPLQWFQGVSLGMVLGGIGLSELGKR